MENIRYTVSKAVRLGLGEPVTLVPVVLEVVQTPIGNFGFIMN